jgi:hypothetical protein
VELKVAVAVVMGEKSSGYIGRFLVDSFIDKETNVCLHLVPLRILVDPVPGMK